MVNNLWSRSLADPWLAVLLLIVLLCVSALAALVVTAVQDARRTRLTTAEALRRDAFTAERRSKLKLLQRRHGKRREP